MQCGAPIKLIKLTWVFMRCLGDHEHTARGYGRMNSNWFRYGSTGQGRAQRRCGWGWRIGVLACWRVRG